MIRGHDRAAQERLQTDRAERSRRLQERSGDGVLSRADDDTRLQPRIERVDHVGGVDRGHGVVLRATDGREQHAPAIDCDLELVLLLEPADRAQVRLEQLHLDHILAVERKHVPRGHAAARSERQPVQMLGLRRVAADAVRLGAGGDRWASDGECADLRRCGEIALEQGRRQAQDLGDVVEPFRRIVGRQEGGRVDLERQQIADGVGILRAIQTMDRGPSGVRSLQRGTVEVRLEPAGECVIRSVVRTQHAGRRHLTGSQLAYDPLPQRRIARDVVQVRTIQHDAGCGRLRCDVAVVADDAVAIDRCA
jgi:hypothetical protein